MYCDCPPLPEVRERYQPTAIWGCRGLPHTWFKLVDAQAGIMEVPVFLPTFCLRRGSKEQSD